MVQILLNHGVQLHHLWPSDSTLEHSNGSIDVERFVPPEDVYRETHGCVIVTILRCHREWRTFNGRHDKCLGQYKGLRELVALPHVPDFRFGQHGE